ncbi:MAG: LamG domain-containing protein, partial [Anaerolineae bacterium]
GSLQDFRVYNYSLEGDAVADLYNANYYALKLDLNEPPGADIFADSSGNNLPGECDSNAGICPDSGIPGRNNQSLRFDGQDDYLTLEASPKNLGLDDGSFTVMAWVKLDSLSGDQTILGADGGQGTNQMMVFAVRDGHPYMRYGGTSQALDNELTSSVTLDTDEWYHLAWVYEKVSVFGDSESATMSIYLNGESVPIATSQVERENNEFNISVIVGNHGGYIWGGGPGNRYLDGLLDDLSIARLALSPEEILAASLQAPVLNLHLDEDYAPIRMGGSFVDDTNNNNDAVCGPNCPRGGDKGQMLEAAVYTATNSNIATDDDNMDLRTFSVSLWVKPTKTISQTQQQLFSKQDGSGAKINFNLSIPSGTLQVEFDLQDASCNSALGPLTTAGELIEDQWNQVAATFDGTSMAVYINGALITSTLVAETSACTAGAQFILGDSSQGFEGSIDEVAVYGTALHAETVSDIFDYQASWFDVVQQHKILIDVDPPEITTTDKVIGAKEDGATVILAVSVVDVASAVALVKYSVNNGAWITANQNSPGSAAWIIEFTPESDGWHTIRYLATDSLGNQSIVEAQVYMDVHAPGIDRDSLGSIASVSDSLTLSGEVIDRGSGVATGTVSIDLLDFQGFSVSGDLAATTTSDHRRLEEADWSIDYPFPVPPYGEYSVLASVEDRAQNRKDGYELMPVYLDSYGPVADVGSYAQVLTDDYFIENPYYGLIGTASDLPDP